MDELGEIISGLLGLALIIGIIALIIAFPLPAIALIVLLMFMRG